MITVAVEVIPARIIRDRSGPQRLPLAESARAQVLADSPAHALNGIVAPPGAQMAAEDDDREGIVRAPPSVRAAPSAALCPVIPERALELVVPESEPPGALLTGCLLYTSPSPRD